MCVFFRVIVYSIAFKSEIGQGNARQRDKNLGERGMFV